MMPNRSMISTEQLAAQTERVFSFLGDSGFSLTRREFIFPESFKGGFTLAFESATGPLQIEYLDCEFQVHVGKNEAFGPSIHPSFAGNMFSPEHLAEHVPLIAERVKEYLASRAAGAV